MFNDSDYNSIDVKLGIIKIVKTILSTTEEQTNEKKEALKIEPILQLDVCLFTSIYLLFHLKRRHQKKVKAASR